MATDNIEICNSALTIVGTRKIVALTDTSVEGRECNANYDICRKACLRDHPWNFATKRVVLSTPDATPPAFGYANRFPLPSDYIREHTVYDSSGGTMDPGSYSVEAGWFLSDEGILWLRYVYDLSTTTQFDALFSEALAANIAAKIAFKITGSESTRQACMKVYFDMLQKAKFTDSVEDAAQVLDIDEWIRARMGIGSFVRDPMT